MSSDWRPLFEKRILTVLIQEPDRLAKLAGILRSNDFENDVPRILYSALTSLFERGDPIEIASIGKELADKEMFLKVGMYSGILGMMDENYAQPSHLNHYVKEILLDERRKKVAVLSARIGQGERLDDELMNELRDLMIPDGEKKETLGDLAVALASRAAAGLALDEGALLTPWDNVNDAILGLCPGTLTLVAARPGRGKTVFVTDVARHVASKGHPVLFFSLEMNREGITSRLLASLSSVDHSAIRRGTLDQYRGESVLQAAEQISEMTLKIDDRGGLSIHAIRALAKRAKEEGGLALVVVDYAQLASSDRGDSRTEEMADVSRGLKDMAKELRVPVLAAAQLNRSGEGNTPKHSQIRECGQFEQDADVILFLYMDEKHEHDEVPEIEVWVTKNRQGPGLRSKLQFQKSRCRMVQIA